jgi:hypothetical protein
VEIAFGILRLFTGISQAGNFVRTFLHLGFNEDESGRVVWDGANANIAARQLPINFRFARPGGAAAMYEPGSEGVLWWGDYRDEAGGLPEAELLARCRASGTCPKVFETFGSAEFWGLRMSPNLVGTRADRASSSQGQRSRHWDRVRMARRGVGKNSEFWSGQLGPPWFLLESR